MAFLGTSKSHFYQSKADKRPLRGYMISDGGDVTPSARTPTTAPTHSAMDEAVKLKKVDRIRMCFLLVIAALYCYCCLTCLFFSCFRKSEFEFESESESAAWEPPKVLQLSRVLQRFSGRATKHSVGKDQAGAAYQRILCGIRPRSSRFRHAPQQQQHTVDTVAGINATNTPKAGADTETNSICCAVVTSTPKAAFKVGHTTHVPCLLLHRVCLTCNASGLGAYFFCMCTHVRAHTLSHARSQPTDLT